MQAPSIYKHFPNKADLELGLVEAAMAEIGVVLHEAAAGGTRGAIARVLQAYRVYCVAHPELYRLATASRLRREAMTPGLEDWAGEPFFLVTSDEHTAQALWAFAHGMVILEIDDRFPPDSRLDRTWKAGAEAFRQQARG
jgi:AcrR family transcriptional regulator